MAHLKIIFLLLFVVLGFSKTSAQSNPVLFAGFELYRDTGFEGNSFANFNVGTQLFHWKFFAPEIGYDLYGGSLQEQSVFEQPGAYTVAPALLQKNFNASFFTVTPKIKIGKEDAFISFSPNFHIGTVNARGRYYELEARKYVLKEGQTTTAPISFWSFSIGVEGLAIQTEKYWFTLFLIYTEIDANSALSKLDFTDYDINSFGINTNTLGFGLRFYYNPFPVKED